MRKIALVLALFFIVQQPTAMHTWLQGILWMAVFHQDFNGCPPPPSDLPPESDSGDDDDDQPAAQPHSPPPEKRHNDDDDDNYDQGEYTLIS